MWILYSSKYPLHMQFKNSFWTLDSLRLFIESVWEVKARKLVLFQSSSNHPLSFPINFMLTLKYFSPPFNHIDELFVHEATGFIHYLFSKDRLSRCWLHNISRLYWFLGYWCPRTLSMWHFFHHSILFSLHSCPLHIFLSWKYLGVIQACFMYKLERYGQQ